MKPQTHTLVASSLLALSIVLSLVALPIKAQGSWIILITTACLAIVWMSVRAMYLRKNSDWLTSSTRREILFAIILASALLAISLGATIARESELIDAEMTKRIGGIAIGGMLMIMGNYMPKRLTHSSCGSNSSDECTRKGRSLQRLVGWIFVIAGLIYAIAWMLVDLERTSVATLLSFPIALTLVVVIRALYLRASDSDHHAGSVKGSQL